MANRPIVDPQLPTPALQPAASPVNTYYAPKVPAPVYQAVTDLSGLSASLAEVQLKMAEKQANVEHTAALAFVQSSDNADLLNQVTEAANAQTSAEGRRMASMQAHQRLIKQGRMDLASSPWIDVAYQEVGAGQVMAKYNQALQLKLSGMSVAVDPKTNLPVYPDNPEKILQDTWKDFSSNPVFSGFYGQSVLNKAKPNIDEDFRRSAEHRIGEARTQGLESMATEQLATELKQGVTKGITPESSALVTETMRRVNLLGFSPEKQNAILGNVVDLTMQYAENTLGAAHARQTLADLRDIKLPQGGTLGSNPSIALDLERRLTVLNQRAETEETHAQEVAMRQLTVNASTATSEFLQAYSKDKTLTFDKWAAAQPADRFGVPTTNVFMHAKRDVEQLLATKYDSETALSQLADATRNHAGPDDLQTLVDSLGQQGALTAETRMKWQGVIDQRRNIFETLKAVPAYAKGEQDATSILTTTLGQVSRTPEALKAYRDGLQQIQLMNAEIEGQAANFDPKDVKGLNAMAQGVQKTWLDRIQTSAAKAVADHSELQAKVARAVSMGSDEATTLLNNANGILSGEEVIKAREDLARKQEFETDFYTRGAWKTEIEQRIEQQFATIAAKNKAGLPGPGMDLPDYALQLQAKEGALAAAQEAVDAWRANPNSKPSMFQSVALAAGRAFLKDELPRLAGEEKAPPITAETTSPELQATKEVLDASKAALTNVRSAVYAGNSQLAAETFTGVATKSLAFQDGGKYLTKAYRNVESESARVDAIGSVSTAAARVKDNPQALAGLSSAVPMTVDDILAGRMVVPYTTEKRKGELAKSLPRDDALIREYLGPAGYAAQVESIKTTGKADYRAFGVNGLIISPSALSRWEFAYRVVNEIGTTYDIKGQPLSPFTYISDVPDWRAFVQQDPARAAAVAQKFGFTDPMQVAEYQDQAKLFQRK